MHRWNCAHSSAPSSSVVALPLLLVAALVAAAATGCGNAGSSGAPDAAGARPPATSTPTAEQAPAITAGAVETRGETRDRMIAALEMQLSGEPLAEAMGRELTAYRRSEWHDLYFDAARGNNAPPIDLAGYASAVESYEYSKFGMNMLAFESGAGISLLDAPRFAGSDGTARLRARVLALGAASNATSRFVHPADTSATNPLGWPGLWPLLHPYATVDPVVRATSDVALNCAITSDDDAERAGQPLISDDYECDYSSLHLPARETQLARVITPGASGWADWKYALWAQNYLQRMHDGAETAVTQVPDGELARVGAPGNTVQGRVDGKTTTPAPTPGTYLGSSDIEGFQAALFLEIVDQQAAHWLAALSTSDGTTLGGFRDLREALAYNAASPLRWFPAEIAVTEQPPAGAGDAPFPRASAYTIRSADSDLLDLAGLIGAYATAYSLTDHANPEAGGSATARAYFDGDPLPDDDQAADGEATLHDRALAMLRVAIVNADRLHRDPATGALVDRVRVAGGGAAARGTVVSADSAAYALVALRAARRALGSELSLYGNTHADTAGVPTPLDALPLGAAGQPVFGERLATLIRDHARVFLDRLTDADGRAFAGWDTAQGAPTDDGASLDAHTAALRGLYTAFLATGDVRYRDRARRVFERLQSAFYDPAARVYRARAGDAADTAAADLAFTPRRFALLQAALRDTYELVAAQPGQDALRARLEARIARLDKLVLNGWDDRNADGVVQWPEECVRVVDGLPRGGLQLAERTLTGETGSETFAGAARRVIGRDRDYDCVPELSAAGASAVLAGAITFHLPAHAPGSAPPDSLSPATPSAPTSPAPVAAPPAPGAPPAVAQHSGPLALSADGRTLFVAHPDADSVTFVDTRTRAVVREVLLAGALPARDAVSNRFDPSVAPRALALDAAGATLYVTGQRSGRLYAVDTASGSVRASGEVVCAEPIGVLLAPDGSRAYVACSQDDEVVALSTRDLAPVARVSTARKPWTLAWAPDGATLLATHLLGPGVSALSVASDALAVRAVYNVPDGPAGDDARVPHGEVRGLYDALVRPGTSELWVVHTMLGTDTPQPALDFERTVFPAVTVLDLAQQGRVLARLTVRVRPLDGGALGDVVSGPHALAFSRDGARAFVADTGSEDLLVIDAARRVESGLVRPLPGHLPEGLVLSPEGGALYLQQRNTEDVVAFRLAATTAATAPASDGDVPAIDGAPIATLARDPMPAELRLGQKLFYSANSDDVPTSRDHWVSCASCHLEGRSDAVTWRFAQGPRDTPSNAGGMRDTGFLFRTAARNRVQDYWRTVNVEQGGHMSATAPAHGPLLDALAAYVNDAIPTPVPPRTDPALRTRGEVVFAQVGCTSCHSGPALTDSGAGNPALDLSGPVLLHDVGTCARGGNGGAADVNHVDVEGHPRAACAFDTPALRGLVDAAPYLHDGSAATLEDVVRGPSAHVGSATSALGRDDVRALVEYLRSL